MFKMYHLKSKYIYIKEMSTHIWSLTLSSATHWLCELEVTTVCLIPQ